jgi:hypothetical protein
MRLELHKQTLQSGEQKAIRQRKSQAEFQFVGWLVSPLLSSTSALRRQTLVSNLFMHVKEIQSIDHGYALRFDRSFDRSDDQEDMNEVIGKIADYIIFESRNAPQLAFEIVEEPCNKTFWLQVQSLGGICPT